MIIDVHCHILPPDFSRRHREISSRDGTFAALFPEGAGRIADVDALLREMDAAGIDRAVAMGFGWTDPSVATEANDHLLEVAAAHPDRISVFASVNPAWGEEATNEAARCLDAGAVGIGELHTDTQRFDIGDASTMAPLVDVAGQHGLVLTTHSSEPVGHSYPGKGRTRPEALWRFIQAFPDIVLVCAHWGGGLPFYALMPEVGAALGNVYFDTAASPFLYEERIFDVATRLVGPEKVLLASDHPLIRPGRVLGELERSGLSPADRAAVAGGNAARLLGLEPCPPSPGGRELEGGGDVCAGRPES